MLTSATLGMAAENSRSGSFGMTYGIGVDQRASNVTIMLTGENDSHHLRVVPHDFEAAWKVLRPSVKIFIVREKTGKTCKLTVRNVVDLRTHRVDNCVSPYSTRRFVTVSRYA